MLVVVCGVLFIRCAVCGTLWGCFECVGCFWAVVALFCFGVGVCVSILFWLSMWLYGSINRGQVKILYPIPHGVYLSLYRILYIEPAYLCAVVSKTLIFLTFSLFCQNSSTLSAIIYYLSDTCIIQGFSL